MQKSSFKIVVFITFAMLFLSPCVALAHPGGIRTYSLNMLDESLTIFNLIVVVMAFIFLMPYYYSNETSGLFKKVALFAFFVSIGFMVGYAFAIYKGLAISYLARYVIQKEQYVKIALFRTHIMIILNGLIAITSLIIHMKLRRK